MTQAHAGCCAGSGQNVPAAATRWNPACIPESDSISTRGEGEERRGGGEGGREGEEER